MSAEPEFLPPPPTAGVCPVCGAPVSAAIQRCAECGCDLAGVSGRPGAYSRTALWWTVAGFVVVYLIVLAVVAVTN